MTKKRSLFSSGLLLLAIVLASCNWASAQTGGGTGGPGGGDPGGGGECETEITRITGVAATSPHEVTVTYELEDNFPKCDTGFSPYYILFRRCEMTQVFGEEIDRAPLSGTSCGEHTLDLDLRHIEGHYTIALILDKPINCFGVLIDTFEMKDGLAIHTLQQQTQLGNAEPQGVGCNTHPRDFSTGRMTLDQDSVTPIGDSAVTTMEPESPGEVISDHVARDVPSFPLMFRLNFHIPAFQSSLGVGGMTTFDSSLHAYRIQEGTQTQIRLVDAIDRRVVVFDEDPNDETRLLDTNGLYRHLTLTDGNGAAKTWNEASQALLTSHTGQVMTFEFFDFPNDGDFSWDREGRVTTIESRDNFKYLITYSTGDDYIIDQVVDPFGAVFDFTYSGKRAGRPAIQQISLPNGGLVKFDYQLNSITKSEVLSSVKIGSVGNVDNDPTWEWNNNVVEETESTRMTISSPTNGVRIYRFEKDYYKPTNGYQPFPLHVLKSIKCDADTERFLEVQINPDDSENVRLLSGDFTTAESGGTISDIQQGVMVRRASLWTYDPNAATEWLKYQAVYPLYSPENQWLPSGISKTDSFQKLWDVAAFILSPENALYTNPIASFAPPINAPMSEWITGSPPVRRTSEGKLIHLEYDSERYLIKRIHDKDTPQESFEEFARNANKQIERHRDRLGRVTQFEYHPDGNLKEVRVGLTAGLSFDTPTADYAVYKYTYTDGLLTTAFSPRHNGEADMYRTDYLYETQGPNIGKVNTIIDSKDKPSDPSRPQTILTWNSEGRLSQTKDPEERITKFLDYDELDRPGTIKYRDAPPEFPNSPPDTDQVRYLSGTSAGFVEETKNRVGMVTKYSYDSCSRLSSMEVAHARDNNILDGAAHDEDVAEKYLQSFRSWVYFDGTNIAKESVVDGKKTEIEVDKMRRTDKVIRHPSANKVLNNIAGYDGYYLRYEEDFMGRRTFYGYDNDGRLERVIIETIPSGTPLPANATNSAVLGQNRDTNLNAKFLIEEYLYDDEDQLIEVTDARNIKRKTDFDSRGRAMDVFAAEGTAKQARTKISYDEANNVEEVCLPRYFDPTDARGYNKSKRTFGYSGRELVESATKILDVGQSGDILATTRFEYFPDGRRKLSKDPLLYDWNTAYHDETGYVQGAKDPLGHGWISNSDNLGRAVHLIGVEGYNNHLLLYHDPIDDDTHMETTTRFDLLGRSVAVTRWLEEQESVDPHNVPVAGLNSSDDGLTSQLIYDNNLADDEGLNMMAGIDVRKLSSATETYELQIQHLTTMLNAKGVSLTSNGSSGSAIVTINPEDELKVTIFDGVGRVVMTARLAKHESTTPLQEVTWSYQFHDLTVDPHALGQEVGSDSGSAFVLEEIRSENAVGDISKVRIDGAGRVLQVLQTVDSVDKATTVKRDNNGNIEQSRDPNQVGFNAAYDELNRVDWVTDTHGDGLYYVYDLAGNAISVTDAKMQSTLTQFDPSGRPVETKDRLLGVTKREYDNNDNLLFLTDSELKRTEYRYDAGNFLKETEFPDHVTNSSVGSSGYGIVKYDPDPLGRVLTITDQAGDSITFKYDLAGRTEEREYKVHQASTQESKDIFTLDPAGRIKKAENTRYGSIVNFTFDSIGRIASEELDIFGKKYKTDFLYDPASRVKQLTYPNGSVVEKTYTQRSQLHETKYGGSVVDTRTYDDGGRLLTTMTGAGLTTSYGYRTGSAPDNRLMSIDTPGVIKFSYAYDSNKNKLFEEIDDGSGKMSAWGFGTGSGNQQSWFDELDRLLGWQRRDGNLDITNDLTLVGDRDKVTTNGTVIEWTTNDAHELENVGGNSVTNSVKGNVTEGLGEFLHEFDLDNQLRKSFYTDNNDNKVISRHYDSFGRWIASSDGLVGASNPLTDIFVHAGSRIVSEYDSAAAVANPRERFVYGSYIDEAVLKDGTGGLLYYHRNAQQSVSALTNTLGDEVEYYAYDPYGGTTVLEADGSTVRNESAFNNHFGFTGRWLDRKVDPTGANHEDLYQFRARWYDPKMGRFLSRDPSGYVDGMSLYKGYFAPQGLDPSGMKDFPFLWFYQEVNGVVQQPPPDFYFPPESRRRRANPTYRRFNITAVPLRQQQSDGFRQTSLKPIRISIMRSCIVCHNPIISNGGSARDLPIGWQIGIGEFVRETDPDKIDRILGNLRNTEFTVIDIGSAWMPVISDVRDVIEGTTGYDAVWQTKLSPIEREAAIKFSLIPGASRAGVKQIGDGPELLSKLFRNETLSPLSSTQRKALKAKVDARTITQQEFKHLNWDRRFSNRRATGVRRFWAQERDSLRAGETGTRPWTQSQIDDILAGRTPKFNGESIQGHHLYNAIDHPHIANEPWNIFPATRGEHFNRWHGRNWQNDTFGRPLNPLFPEDF